MRFWKSSSRLLVAGCWLLVAGCWLLVVGCYSFQGISIPPEVKSYYVDPLKNNATNSTPGLSQELSEALKEKIRTESRLVFADTDPDIEFKGTVVRYEVTSEAPQAGRTAALNRLTIMLAIEYIDNSDEEKGWKKNFSHYYDFSSNTNLSDIEDTAVEEITENIMEQIFNTAFTDW